MNQIAIAVKHMLAAGMSPEAVVAAVAEMEGAADTRSAGAKRQQRYRERNKASQTVTRDDGDAPLSPASLSPEPPITTPSNPPPPSPPKGGSSPTPKRFANPAITLQAVLDPLTAKTFVDHCEQKRRDISAPAAEEIVGVLRRVAELGGNPAEAARFAIRKGWTTIDLEWLQNGGFPFKSGGGDPLGKLASWSADRWRIVLEQFEQTSQWQRETYGPRPGEPGCLVPAELLKARAA